MRRAALRRSVLLVAALGVLGMGTTACSDGDTQGRQDPDLNEVESQVAQLRLEVQSLRREVQSLRDAVPTTTTTVLG